MFSTPQKTNASRTQQAFEKFDIRNFQDQLEPSKAKNKFICPVCGGNDLSIVPETGKYRCFNNCECKDIREAIKPWAEVVAERAGANYTPSPRRNSPQPKTVKPKTTIIPEDFALVALTDRAIAIPQPQPLTSKPPKGIPGHASQVTYPYSQSQWVVRYQWKDTSKEKGYNKSFRQWHRLPDGTPEMRKGDEPWRAYRLDEAIAASKLVQGTPAILQHEGEGCVEVGREHGLAGFTFQGSAWDKKSILPEYQLIKDSGIGLIIFLHDPDDTGLKKLASCLECAAEVGIALIGINPNDICPDLPYKSSDIKEILGQMEVPEFIRRLEAEIHVAVNARQAAESHINNDASTQETGTSFLQQAYHYLFGDKSWICANDELYYHARNHYKYSPDSKERRRISDFCDAYKVEAPNGKITYPYASPTWVKKVLEWAKMRTEIDPELINPPGVNCINGIVRAVWNGKNFTITLDPHTPEDYFIYEPLIEYDPNADSTDCERLLACLDKPQQEVLLRNLAASLDLQTVRKVRGREAKALLAVGLGSNGKDAIRKCVSIIYGETGITSISLSDFQAYDEGRKFGLAPLMHSRLNWASENPQTCRLDRIQSLKLFVTGNKLHCERKGKDHIEFTPNAPGIFNLNETPPLQGVMQATQDRIAVLEFLKTFVKNPDPNNPNELQADSRFADDSEFVRTKVAPAFLNKMLEALNNLIEEGIDYECTTDAFRNVQKDNNHLFQFLEDNNIGYLEGGEISARALWSMLEMWYTQNGTLTVDESNRRTWIDQARPSDKNVKGINQIIPRISQLFPKAVKGTRYCDVAKRNIPILKGIGILSATRTTLGENRTTSAPLPAPETTLNQDFRTTRTTFSNSTENIEDQEMQLNILTVPMEKEEYVPPTGASGAEPLPDKENCCVNSCVTGADQLESGAGMPTEDLAAIAAPIASDTVLVKAESEFSYSLLQFEKDGGDIAGFVGCQVEVRSLSGAVKFAGEMINYDSKNGIVTVDTEQGNRDAILCETFVID
ncbi:heavy metal transporter [Nostoc sp. UCD121]|nr:heavy metal transporter [Nostoc sp. UCD121]